MKKTQVNIFTIVAWNGVFEQAEWGSVPPLLVEFVTLHKCCCSKKRVKICSLLLKGMTSDRAGFW